MRMNYLLPFIMLLMVSSQALTQSLYYVRQDFNNGPYFLSLYNTQTCQSTDVSPIDFSDLITPIVLDLAVTPSGDFYFLTATYVQATAQLIEPYCIMKFDATADTTSIAATIPYFCNSLVCDGNGILYAAGEDLYSYNTWTNIGFDHGFLNFTPSGDLTIINGKLYCASYFPPDNLMEVNIETPSQSTVFAHFVLPEFEYVWGIVSIPESCDSTSIFFAAAELIDYGPSSVYQYNLEDQSLTFYCTAPAQITGFTSPDEFNSYDCTVHLNLDADASSGAPFTDWQAPLLCVSGSLMVADSDATYYSGFYTDSIRFRLLGPAPDAPLEYLSALPSGTISASGQGTGWLSLTSITGTSAATTNADYQAVLRTVRWHDDANPPTPGSRTVQVIAFTAGGYSDTAYAYLPVPPMLSAGKDTAFTVCADAQSFTLLAPGSIPGGLWSPMLAGGVFLPQSDSSGMFAYTVGGGFCPADTAFVTVDVLPLPSFSLGQDTSVCSNHFPFLLTSTAPVVWQNGNNASTFEVTQPGKYWAERVNAAACRFRDSISVLASPVYSTTTFAQPCHGQAYTWNGQNFTRDTVVCTNFVALNGCDSTPCLQLTYFYPSLVLDTSICGNQTLSWQGQDLSSTGIYTDTLLLNGCLTATVLFLEVYPLDTMVEHITICNGESFSAGGQVFSSPGQYFVPLHNLISCDTILRLDLTVRPTAESTQTAFICPGAYYVFDGDSLTIPGDYTAKFNIQTSECDSTVTLTLMLFPAPAPQITGDTVFCNGGGATLSAGTFAAYQWSGGASTASLNTNSAGIYSVTVTSANGCTATAVKIGRAHV